MKKIYKKQETFLIIINVEILSNIINVFTVNFD